MCDMMSQASAWLLRANINTVQIYNAFTGQPFDEGLRVFVRVSERTPAVRPQSFTSPPP